MVERKRELRRDEKRGKVGGVCAGIANYFGWELWVIRIIAVTALILATKVTLVAYVIAWLVLDKESKKAKAASGHSEQAVREETRVERTADGRTIEVKTKVWEAGKLPHYALGDIENEFAVMEKSLRSIESYVTSSEFRVRHEINRL
ncbi:envelope stress response membrane protein PspC [Aliidiomarina shirensis]|uniref:Envelope stress response membrane protein PspC n=1 Tax=Aliidiomarina shirensis TaxID=1048642 RepID=A0A432WWY5_9GAMM|nr:envelope stress response membrane protein PspC [Aliidiomarina shirensis]RUO38261.1 envelope stress response membrane protein PspC [Aliidiomarina shirensis]